MKRQSLLLFGWLLLAMPAAVQAQFTYTTNNGGINITRYTGTSSVVAIPDTITGLPVTVIGNGAFSGDTSLTRVTVPNSVTSISYGAFSECINLTYVVIPNSATSIGDYAFNSCHSLTSIIIPNSVTSIGYETFSGCASLRAIAVETNNPAYSSVSGVLFDKSQTTLIEYPAGNVATSYAIPNTVTNIGDHAFSDCTILTSVIIPDSVTSSGAVFAYCTSLRAIIVETNNPAYSSLSGVLFNKSQTTLVQYPAGNVATSYAIPNTVTNIGGEAFARTSLTSVIIPDSVTSIGEYAFGDCTSLTSVTLSNSIIGDGEFSGCTSLANIIIPNSVTGIGNSAFAGTSLTSVTIPNSVTNIGAAFFNCTSLTSVTLSNGIIGDGEFSGCTSLANIIIPNSVTSIGDSAFAGTSLTSVTIPNSVTNIGAAFATCTSLTSVTLSNSIIGVDEFSGCTNLTNITIPNSITSIGDSAFAYCTSLAAINVETNNPAYRSVSGVLFDKSQTTLVQYPAGNFATSYAIPNSVTSIGDYAFSSCTSLTSVTIGTGVTTIGGEAFSYCTNLASLFFMGNAPYAEIVTRYHWGPPDYYFVFSGDNATAYYLPGTTGWDSTFGGIPTALWTLPNPLILNNNLGVRSNQFGFTFSGATNLTVVMEASTDLANPIWTPLATNALAGGWFYFADPQWVNYPKRFYRIRSR